MGWSLPASASLGTDEENLRGTSRKPQALGSRLAWFAAGAGINYLLIATPFAWLEAHTRLPIWLISMLSVGSGTLFFFAWNYFLNFRTHRPKGAVLARYLPTVAALWLLSSGVLTGLKHVDAHLAFSVGALDLDLDVVGTQVFVAGLRFLLYHKWVFPAD